MSGTSDRAAFRVSAGIALAGALVGACRSSSNRPSGAVASASASAAPLAASGAASADPYSLPVVRHTADAGPLASGIPVPEAQVEASLNPAGRPPYAGPVGTVIGVVRIAGDAPPKADVVVPPSCAVGAATYGKLFREGIGHAAADVLVAVTGYDAFVPAKSEIRPVRMADCAYETRTIDATYGQRLEVRNLDARAYVPELVGAYHPASLVAVPHGDAVPLYPTSPGHYLLTEGGHDFLRADVFVLRYPTHTVTGLDGAFRIEGVPVGKAKVSALLPAIGRTVEQSIEVREGENPAIELTLPFDAKKDVKKPAPAPSGIPTPR